MHHGSGIKNQQGICPLWHLSTGGCQRLFPKGALSTFVTGVEDPSPLASVLTLLQMPHKPKGVEGRGPMGKSSQASCLELGVT